MKRVNTGFGLGSPQFDPTKNGSPALADDDTFAVRSELQIILQSQAFSQADSLRALLEFTVERALAGQLECIKEYVLGSEVLGRGERFDPKVDPIVRVQMRRLRDRLAIYYCTEGVRDALGIGFKKGSYVPVLFARKDAARCVAADPVGDSKFSRFRQAIVVTAGAVLLLILSFGFRLGFAPWHPIVGTTSVRARAELDAYELYLKGRYLLGQARVASAREAVSFLQQAIAKDPSFAPAYSALADGYSSFLVLEIMPPGEVVPKIKDISMRALAITPGQAEAHASLAGALAWEWKTVEAEAEYKAGLHSNPNSPAVNHAYSVFLAAHGEFDRALAHIDRAIALDSLSANHRVARAVILYWARRYLDSTTQAREAIEMAPNHSMAHHILGALHLQQERFADAVRELDKAAELSDASTFDVGFEGLAYGCAGNRRSAHRILDLLMERSQREYVAPLSLALVHLGLGDRSKALSWIERAYVPGAAQWPFFAAAPLYDPLRSEPRFKEIVRQIGLSRRYPE